MRHIALAIALTLSTAVIAPTLAQTTTTTAPSPFWEKMKGGWSQTKGAVKEQWGKLTDDDLLEIEGRRDQLVGKIQTRYGMTREEAERQVGDFERSHRM